MSFFICDTCGHQFNFPKELSFDDVVQHFINGGFSEERAEHAAEDSPRIGQSVCPECSSEVIEENGNEDFDGFDDLAD